MMRSYSTIAAVLLVCTTSCSTPQPVEIRAASSTPQIQGLGEAQGQLALGNVALALEGFRKVLRDNPDSVDAAVGIAHCYENMGRFDLSRRWFETALASAPENAAVLNDFASSLERQGKYADAASVRAETVQLVAAAAVAEPLQSAEFVRPAPADVAVESTPSLESSPTTPIVTLHLPPPAPVQKAEPLKLAPASRAEVTLPAPVEQARVVLPAPVEQAEALKPQRLVSALIASEPRETGPRLERLSLGEVALITRPTPTWSAKIVERTAQSVTFRWVPLRPVARLLNAARNEGLAARTRARLAENGWRRIEIGNAPMVRAKTLVLYPEYRRHTAQKLAAQFGFTQLKSFSGNEIVVLLGRDAAALKALRPA
ncbi:MAG TPA: LytR C-terminal domain-containing protein [Sphingomicrobium sp.]|nr:LytR C-terminal domain-containing protein [Sphingomicrobium sp.]